MPGLARIRREAAPHAVMVAVMLATMLGEHTALRSMLGAGVLLAASLFWVRRARTSTSAWCHIADFWAMALVLVALAAPPVTGHHSHGTPSVALSLAMIVSGWLVARVLLVRGSAAPVVGAASAAVAGLGLVVMVVVCG